MHRVFAVLIAGGLAAGLVAIGCGGGEDNSSAAESEGGKAVFVSKGNAICASQNRVASAEIRDAYGAAAVRGASTEREAIDLEVKTFVPILLSAAQAEAGEMRALEAPSGEEAEVEAILEAYDAWIAKATGTPFKVVIANDVYNEARELAGEYGLTVCARSPFEAG